MSRIHRARFFAPKPETIHCLAYDGTSLLAALRADSIELWNVEAAAFLQGVICTNRRGMTAVTWCGQGRLFATGLEGYITEYDITKLAVRLSVPVVHGPSWCMAANKEQSCIAVGTEDGHISLYSVMEDTLVLEKTFDKQENRVVCLAWHPEGNIIASGSIDVLKLWNVNTGRCIESVEVGRDAANVETIVWCIAVTSDMVVITGDSLGRTSFWDGNTGTLLNCFTNHKADVLCLSLSKDETVLHSAGVDPLVAKFVQVAPGGMTQQKCKWVYSLSKNIHTHDVRALVEVGDYLVSAGVDSFLAFSRFPPYRVIKHIPYQQRCIQVTSTLPPCVLMQYPNKLLLWHLGSTSSKKENRGKRLSLKTEPSNLLEYRSHNRLVCSAIKSDATLVAVSDAEKVKVFDLNIENSTTPLACTASLCKKYSLDIVAHLLIFAECSDRLMIAKNDGNVEVWIAGDKKPVLVHAFHSHKGIASRVQQMAVSSDDQFFVVADSQRNIVVYNLKTYQVHCLLPTYSKPLTALAIHPKSNNLLITYSDQMVFEYSLQAKSYTKRSNSLSKKFRVLCSKDGAVLPLRGVVFHDMGSILLYDQSRVYVVDHQSTEFNEDGEFERDVTKCAKKANAHTFEKFEQCPVGKCLDMFEYIVALQKHGEGELVVVETTSDLIHLQLPPPLEKKVFGT